MLNAVARVKNRTPTARRPYHLSRCAAAPFAMQTPLRLYHQPPLVSRVGIRLRELRREDWRGVVLQVFSQQFSVAQASAGVRSRLAGIGGQKTKRTQARLWKFSFFESHIRATNAPARRTSIMTRYSAALASVTSC